MTGVENSVTVFWFRRDLRLNDNIGLYMALQSDSPVIPVFIFDDKILNQLTDKSDLRVSFIHQALQNLREELKKMGSDLLILHGDVKKSWEKIISTYKVEHVYCNEDYEPQAIRRDDIIRIFLERKSIDFHIYKDQVIFSKNDILKKDLKPYSVYTAYKNKWLESLTPEKIQSYNNKKLFKNFKLFSSQTNTSISQLGFIHSPQLKVKKSLSKKKIITYDLNRDIPSLDATTRVSVHLRFGTISIRKCVQIATQTNQVWLQELIWREFFMQILYHFPHVVNAPFKAKYQNIKWRNNKKEFEAWCEGRTGYPIVDAGMRELNQTGFMHNRVRMITASFLVKDLLIDWRWGEKYFAQKLIDYDQSANNGNWQWVAGTGCDSAPYFRIFNPDTQQKKFDPQFKYVKKWIPEYGTDTYPKKIVDHNMAYHRALMTIKEGING